MNSLGASLGNLYKKVWSRLGGRPWTYILRDLWHEVEWLAQAQWFFLGAIAFWLTGSWKIVLLAWALYSAGYLNGHLLWGTTWKPGQKGD